MVDESRLVEGLRRRDSAAFATLVDRYAASMLRVARGYVRTEQDAEDVVQDTWIAVMKGINGFEGRAKLKTWLYTILANVAKSHGIRDRRDQQRAVLWEGPTVDADRFYGEDDARRGGWKQPPAAFPDTPEESALAHEFRTMTGLQIDALPERQRAVVMLRDVLDFDSTEVCTILQLSATNQRVLLHRGRATIRQALETYLRDRQPEQRP